MEKLIELLNEFMEEKKSSYRFTEIINDGDFFYTDKTYGINQDGLGYETIISKKFGFIKWLVDNDKIDLYKVRHHFCIELYAIDYGDGDYMCQDYEIAIAVLAIQEKPIEFLISILK